MQKRERKKNKNEKWFKEWKWVKETERQGKDEGEVLMSLNEWYYQCGLQCSLGPLLIFLTQQLIFRLFANLFMYLKLNYLMWIYLLRQSIGDGEMSIFLFCSQQWSRSYLYFSNVIIKNRLIAVRKLNVP